MDVNGRAKNGRYLRYFKNGANKGFVLPAFFTVGEIIIE